MYTLRGAGVHPQQQHLIVGPLVDRPAGLVRREERLGEAADQVARRRRVRLSYVDADVTLEDLREALTTLEELERIARRVFGGAHPLTLATEEGLRVARAVLRARDPPPSSP